MGTVTVNRVRLEYDDAGTGPAVVWVHGGFTDRRGASAIAPLLSARHRFIAYDRRGHSGSERAPGRQSVDDHVADLGGLVEALDAAPAHLLGNSDGGEVALKLAARRPDLVASVCVHEPSCYFVLPEPPDLAWLHRAVAALERGDDAEAARVVMEDAALGPGAWAALPEASRRLFVHNAPPWLDTARDPTYGRIDPDDLARLTMPVLLTVGGEALPTDVAIVARLGELMPTARRHTFAGAGHVPHRTHPAGFATVVTAFVDAS